MIIAKCLSGDDYSCMLHVTIYNLNDYSYIHYKSIMSRHSNNN